MLADVKILAVSICRSSRKPSIARRQEPSPTRTFIQPHERNRADDITEPHCDYDPYRSVTYMLGYGKRGSLLRHALSLARRMGALKSLKQLLNDQVVKCSTDSCKRYCFMRFCDDKARANHTSAGDSVIESITDRVMEKDCCREGDKG